MDNRSKFREANSIKTQVILTKYNAYIDLCIPHWSNMADKSLRGEKYPFDIGQQSGTELLFTPFILSKHRNIYQHSEICRLAKH